MTPDNKSPDDDVKALEGTLKPPLNWEGGKKETAANRGKGDRSTAAGAEYPNGDRGEASGRNQEQQAAVSGTPGKS